MLTRLLPGTDHSICVVFLAGWGMDPTPFARLPRPAYDVLVVYDYRDLHPLLLTELLDPQAQLHLVAWSMGVWVAGTLFADMAPLFCSTTAINGTLRPIDERFGIAPMVYDQMLKTFSVESLDNFRGEMFTAGDELAFFVAHQPQRSLTNVQEELRLLACHYRDHGPARDIFARKIVGSRDRIMPARSQIRAWGREACQVVTEPHFPFYHWQGLYPPATNTDLMI